MPEKEYRARRPAVEALELRLFLSSGAYDFGQVGRYNIRAVVADARGVLTTFSLIGGGSGHVAVSDAGLDLTLDNTGTKSAVSISSKGGRGQIRNISASGSLGRLDGSTVDVSGDVIISGTIATLNLGNILGQHTITIGAGIAPASISLKNVTDTSMQSSTPIKSLSVNGWFDTDATADVINVPSITKLSARGNFGNSLTTASIASASIGGTWSGSTVISGSAGNLKMSRLRGTLQIMGAAAGIWSGDYVATAPGPAPTGGVFNIAGATVMHVAGESFKMTGQIVYATAAGQMYTPEELLRYDDLGATRIYNASSVINGQTHAGSVTESVEGAQGTFDGASDWIVDLADPSTQTSQSTAFVRDSTGTYLGQIDSTDNATGQILHLKLGSLRLSPPAIGIHQTFSNSSTVTGTLHIPDASTSPPSEFDADVAGTARTSIKLLGHQSITVPAGSYLAVGLQITRTLDLMASARTGLFIFQRMIHITETTTLYAVPGIGAIQSDSAMINHTSTLGFSSHWSLQSTVTKEDRQLAQYTL